MSPRFEFSPTSASASAAAVATVTPQDNFPPDTPDAAAAAAGGGGQPLHRCRLCNKQYERADHLNRHLRSRKLYLFGFMV